MTTRLLHIVPTLEYAGPQKQMMLLSGQLPRADFDVKVFSLNGVGPLASELERQSINVIPKKSRHQSWGHTFQQLSQSMKDWSPDIVHTWTATANWIGRAAAIRHGVPQIVATQPTQSRDRSTTDLISDRFLARWTSSYVVRNDQVKLAYQTRGVSANKIHVIPNGVEQPGSPHLSRANLLEKLKLPSDARMIGTVAR